MKKKKKNKLYSSYANYGYGPGNTAAAYFGAGPSRITWMGSGVNAAGPNPMMKVGDPKFYKYGGMMDYYGMGGYPMYQMGGGLGMLGGVGTGMLLNKIMMRGGYPYMQVGGYASGPDGRRETTYGMSTLPSMKVKRDTVNTGDFLGVSDQQVLSTPNKNLLPMIEERMRQKYGDKYAGVAPTGTTVPGGRIAKVTQHQVTARTPAPVTFNDAFRQARNAGMSEFTFNGNLYNTNTGGGAAAIQAGATRMSNTGTGRTITGPTAYKEMLPSSYRMGGKMMYQMGGQMMPQGAPGMEDPSNDHMMQLMMQEMGQPAGPGAQMSQNPQMPQAPQMPSQQGMPSQGQVGSQEQMLQDLVIAAVQGDEQAMQALVEMVGPEQAMQIIQEVQQELQGQQGPQPQRKNGGKMKKMGGYAGKKKLGSGKPSYKKGGKVQKRRMSTKHVSKSGVISPGVMGKQKNKVGKDNARVGEGINDIWSSNLLRFVMPPTNKKGTKKFKPRKLSVKRSA